MLRTRYDKKIKKQAALFYDRNPVLPPGHAERMVEIDRLRKPLEQKLNAHHRQCDAQRIKHEEKHGTSYPYFECKCGVTFEHSQELWALVDELNRLWYAKEDIASVGVRAHIERGKRAWEAKEKWAAQKRSRVLSL